MGVGCGLAGRQGQGDVRCGRGPECWAYIDMDNKRQTKEVGWESHQVMGPV